MTCTLPQSYVDALPGRIQAARRARLLALLPQGVEGGGSDQWWDGGFVSHEGGGHYYSGNRWRATCTPEWVGVTETGRTVSVTFTINLTHEQTGEVYPCEICNPTQS